MTIADYIAIKKEQNTTMCAAILYPDGEIEECITSHLKTLIERLGEDAWDQIPKDESPLFWLTGLTGAVLIDYENQVYSEALSDEQDAGLKKMYASGILTEHPCVIHFGNEPLGIMKENQAEEKRKSEEDI